MRKISIILLGLLVLCGCATQKSATRYITRNPEILNDFIDTTRRVEYRDSIIYRDSLVPFPIPGDTVYDDTIINVTGLLSGAVRVDTKLASARAWIKGGKLHIELIQHKQILQILLDSAIVENVRTEIIYDTQWLPSEPYIPKMFNFYKYGYFINQVLVLLMIVLLIRGLKR